MRRKFLFILAVLVLCVFAFALMCLAQDQQSTFEGEDPTVSSADLVSLNQSLKKLIDANHALLTQSEALQQKLDELQAKGESQESRLHALTTEKTAAQKKIKDLNQALEIIKNAQAAEKKVAQPTAVPAITMSDVAQMFSQLIEEGEMIRQQTAKTHHALAYLLLEQGRHDDAASEFAQVVNVIPYDAAAHYNLAFICEEYLKDHKAALEHYRKYVELAPDAADAASVKLKISQLDSIEEKRIDAAVSVQNGGRNDTR